jgi:uncharacterized protein (TIGR00288 family)
MPDSSNPKTDDAKIAVFIDFENIAFSADNHFGDFDLGLLLKAIQQRGRITLKRAYGDWSRLGKYRDAVRENAMELVQLYAYNQMQGGKNRADIRLVIDAMESLFTLNHIDTIVIVSGDSDFSSLMSKAREYGKHTIGLGVKATTSDLLLKACDEFIFYDELVEASYLQLKARREDAPSETVTEQKLIEVLAPKVAAAAATQAVVALPDAQSVITKLPPPPVAHAEAVTLANEDEPLHESLRYFFEDLRMPLLAADVRANLLNDLLAIAQPGKTLNDAINQLKAKYDFENAYRRREEIRTVAKLAFRTGLFDFGNEHPSLASFIKQVKEPDPERANRRADKTLLRLALDANYKLSRRETAEALFGADRDAAYVGELLEELVNENYADDEQGRYFVKRTDAFTQLLEGDEFYQIKYDLAQLRRPANEVYTANEMDRLFDKATEWRRNNFEASANCALQGCKVQMGLYQQRQPGLGTDGFHWGIATYASARAGVSFRKRDHQAAQGYYLAFFRLLQEGDYAWEMLRPLLPSLSSYYWMTITHELRLRIHSFTGHNAPGDTVMAITRELNDFGREKLGELASDLASVNAAQLRALIAQIEAAPAAPEQEMALKILSSAF